MIKTVILDLGGVYFTNGTERAIGTISARYDVPESKVEKVLKGELGKRYRTGEIKAGEFLKKALVFWAIDMPDSELGPIWVDGYKPIQGTVDIVDRLKESDYELIFLSNNVKERVDYLEEKYPFIHRFNDGIFSHVVRVRKPDPKIYKLALEKASHSANECVYVDDKPEFLKPAEKLGMKTIAFKNPGQLESELRELGFEF